MQRLTYGRLVLLVGLSLALWANAYAQTYSRTEVVTYHDNTNIWVLGQQVSVVCAASVPVSAICNGDDPIFSATYDPSTAQLLTTSSFGKLQQTLTYDSTATIASGQLGTLKTVKDGNNNVTTLSNWKRGIPQAIAFAGGTSKSAVVDDFGLIASVTDESGYITSYGYDAMGRLSLIDYPNGDTANWNDTTISFAPATATPYGLPNGHWRRTEATGTARKITYFDALWRPVIQEVYDTANTWGTITQTITRYDAEGRVTFASYPQRVSDSAVYVTWANMAVAPNATGVDTVYDVLGRPTSVQADSELPGPPLTTTYEYQSGFMTRVTNPRGYQTVTQYQAFDQPSTSAPSGITSLAGADTMATEIHRDIFGKPTLIKRRNEAGTFFLDRHYVYDGNQRLCKTIEPETGATVIGYDNADNINFSASGLTLTSLTDCEHLAAWNSGRRVERGYDTRNRLQTLAFPDGRGNQSWEYWPDGLAKKITTYNDVASGGVVENAYSYNKRRLLTAESITEPGNYTWSLGYGYSTLGHVASLQYPTGLALNYAPNALGQPAQAGTYATGVSYYPNGGMQQFTYGNGIVHTMAQNTRQLPDTSQDAYGSTLFLSDGYDYDQNGNVAAISDGTTGNRGNRNMTYDSLDRLLTAVSPMFGSASYTYDVLDNLTRVNIGGPAIRDHYYCYDASNRLTNVKTGGCNGASVIGLGYDVQGNVVQKNSQQYEFDYGNRLRNVPDLENYRYDGNGRRVVAKATTGDIYSFYGQDGVLRSQRNERKAEAYDYITLNGSLVARVTDPNSVIGVPTLTAPVSSGPSYTVQWTAVANATRYELEESFNSGAWAGIYSGTALSLARSGQAAGTHKYRVKACRNTPCGGVSAEVTTLVDQAPATPTLTAPALGTNGNYTVSWTAATGATSYVLDEYAASAWAEVYNGAGLSKTYSTKPAGSYGYRIKACNTYGCSAVSATSTVQSLYPPGAPTVTVPASSYTGSYTVSWAVVSGATSYQLEESANGGAWVLVQDSAATSKAYTGKADGSYSYRAKACNAAGCSVTSASVGIAVLTPPIAVPTVTAPANNYTGSYTVNWTTVPKATSYTLHVKVNGAVNGTNIYSGPGSSHNVSGQGAGSYAYYVLACNGAGCANWSAPSTTQVALIPIPPAPVIDGYAEDIIPKTFPLTFDIYLSWNATTGATYYELKKNVSTTSTTIYSGSNLSYHLVGQGNWTFQVRACNAAGCSAWSNTYVQ